MEVVVKTSHYKAPQEWKEKSKSTELPYVPLIRLDLYQQPAFFIMPGCQFIVGFL